MSSKKSSSMNLKPKARKRGRAPVTVAAPYAAKQVLDKNLWQEGRKKIADAALPLFARHGYHATPVRAIADAVGLSVGSIFNYFPEKDDILKEILDGSQVAVESAVEDARRQLATDDAKSPPIALFMGVYRRFVEFTAEIHRFTLLAYQETKALTREKRSPLLRREQHIAQLLKEAAAPAIRAGVFSDDALDLKVQCLIVLGHAWAVRHWAYPQYRGVGDYLADLEPIALAIMAAGTRDT